NATRAVPNSAISALGQLCGMARRPPCEARESARNQRSPRACPCSHGHPKVIPRSTFSAALHLPTWHRVCERDSPECFDPWLEYFTMASRAPDAAQAPDRRSFLSRTSGVAMAGGLIAGYGTLAVMAGRFLYPSEGRKLAWIFVTDSNRMKSGES